MYRPLLAVRDAAAAVVAGRQELCEDSEGPGDRRSGLLRDERNVRRGEEVMTTKEIAMIVGIISCGCAI